jgi:hypothetical protein
MDVVRHGEEAYASGEGAILILPHGDGRAGRARGRESDLTHAPGHRRRPLPWAHNASMRFRLLVHASASALLLSAGFAATASALGTTHKGPRIKSGRYVDGIHDVYLDVDVKQRTVMFHFTLYCDDLFADQWVSSGPKPVRGGLRGNRRGATVYADGEYEGLPAVGPGTSQVADWILNGKFTGPTRFEGRVEYEAATFPEPMARPQCVDEARIRLTRER